MQTVDEEIETIHLYVVREKEKRPYTAFPLFCAFLCLLGIVAVTLYSAQHPYYEHERLTVPTTFLPLKVFEAQAPIIPTGVKTYPATYAIGTLTLTNGSVLSEVLPSGVIFGAGSGIEVQTTESVFIPAGSASGYGVATVPARALTAGKTGNIQTLAVNAVYGTALYIRNLVPFTGGNDVYSVKFITSNDRNVATSKVRAFIVSNIAQVQAFLASPCKEIVNNQAAIVDLIVNCQFAVYRVPSYMRVLGAKLAGRDFLVTVEFIPRPQKIWVK
jgi:Baseplate J-like protein